MTTADIMAQVESTVRDAKVRNPLKRYELAKTLINEAFAQHGVTTSPMQVAHFANQMKRNTIR
jgi:hypothetical protein